MNQQLFLPLNFSSTLSYGTLDFCLSDSNKEAYGMIEKWPQWSHFCVIIYGPSGSGKTHLSHLFQEKSQAISYQLTKEEAKTSHHVILDDISFSGVLTLEEETELFHLYNHLQENQKTFLILTDHPPAHWKFKLFDLSSRLRSSSCLGIQSPDDELLFYIYTKLFSDYQISVSPRIITYLVKTFPRSLENAKNIVETLVQRSLDTKKPITIPFITKTL